MRRETEESSKKMMDTVAANSDPAVAAAVTAAAVMTTASPATTSPPVTHDLRSLMARARVEAEKVLDISTRGARVLVVTHIDADGLSSGSVAFSALARKNVAVSVRAIPDLDPRAIERLRADNFDFYLFTDLGSGLLEELSRAFGERFLVVDHHQVPEGDLSRPGPPQRLELRVRRGPRGLLFHDGLRLRQGTGRACEPGSFCARARRCSGRPPG